MGYSARRGFTNGKISGAARQAAAEDRGYAGEDDRGAERR